MASVKSSRSAVMDSSRSRSSKVDNIEKSSSRSTGRGGGETLPKIGGSKETEDKPADTYDDIAAHPVMFGDPFGNRGDYSKGRSVCNCHVCVYKIKICVFISISCLALVAIEPHFFTQGIFYGGRKKFLYSKDPKPLKDKAPAAAAANSLEPPLEFMTMYVYVCFL
jgi:hypothetical protein